MLRTIIALLSVLYSFQLCSQAALINEINYAANDPEGHGVEVLAEAGEDLTGWSLLIYSAGGALEQVIDLSGALIPNNNNGYGTVWYDVVQNDGGNGAALADPSGVATEFVSYGTTTAITALEGPAAGMAAEQLDVLGATGILALTGSSYDLFGFNWVIAATSSPGSINTDQVFMSLMEQEQIVDIKGPGVEEVYPNPFVDSINVRFAPVTETLGTLSLFDLKGSRVQVQTIPVGSQMATMQLKRDLPSGTYVLRLDTRNESWSKKIIH